MNRTVDLTPTWAGLMPALIAALQHGTGEGPAMTDAESVLYDMTRRAMRAALALAPAFPGPEGARVEAAATYTTTRGVLTLRAVFDGHSLNTDMTLTPAGGRAVGVGYLTARRYITERIAALTCPAAS